MVASAWANLDALLSEFEQSRAFVFRHISAVQPRQALGILPDGAAQWMNDALLNPDAPYHEDGYSDWFDYLQRSPKVNYFRKLYSVMRAYITTSQNAPESSPDQPLPSAPPSPAA